MQQGKSGQDYRYHHQQRPPPGIVAELNTRERIRELKAAIAASENKARILEGYL
jgi:hypothetical protein